MPPSNFGARASMATAWNCDGSPTGCAPASSIRRSTVPVLYGVPRTMKLFAASPQISFSQSMFDSKPPAARTKVFPEICETRSPCLIDTDRSLLSAMSMAVTSAPYRTETFRRSAAA